MSNFKLHKLKIDSEIIDMKIKGIKNWEIRFDDSGTTLAPIKANLFFDNFLTTFYR